MQVKQVNKCFFHGSLSKAKFVTLSKARFENFAAENLCPNCTRNMQGLTNTCSKMNEGNTTNVSNLQGNWSPSSQLEATPSGV